MDSERLLRDEFGLTTYEAKAYLSLLRRPMSAAEIAQASGVPQSRIYDTIRSLAAKGFARESVGSFHAVKPATALRARLARFTSEFASSQAARETAMDRVVEETRPLTDSTVGSREPEMLRGMDSIVGAFLEILRSSRDVLIVVRKGIRASSEFLAAVKANDGTRPRIRVLALQTARISAAELEEAKGLGLDVRRSPSALLDMMVGDSGDVILGVPAHGVDEAFGAVAVRVREKAFSDALRSTLERLWKEARH